MKGLFKIFFLLICSASAFGQRDTLLEKGAASYVSSQNVYVKFPSTEHINKGDTLFVDNSGKLTPALVVKDKSSTSCVCSSLLPEKVAVGTTFTAKCLVEKKPEKPKSRREEKPVAPVVEPDSTLKPTPLVIIPAQEDKDDFTAKQKIKGRLSAASYSNFYDGAETHRMRYALTFQGANIKNSRFSVDNYITFRHTIGEWAAVKENLHDALKVYSFSVKYDLDKSSYISIGRRINQRIGSMGAIDGLQMEKGFGHYFAGAIAGSRPDYSDYSFNPNLLQFGAFVGHGKIKGAKSVSSTLAFVEQHNHAAIDRRFVYFQHSNTLVKDLSMFSSFEVDLFQNINDTITHKPSLTNLLVSLRYRISKKLSLSGSYDNRKNIIYYESYKSYIDQLIDDETRQGLRLGGNYRVSKLITLGVNSSWRFQASNINLSKNLNAYLNFSRLPWIKASASLSANFLQTNYLDSKIYGIRLNKELIRGKLNGEVNFRMVEYNYKNYENKISQMVPGADLSWNITRKLALYLYYEGTFDNKNASFTRINTRIIQRF